MDSRASCHYRREESHSTANTETFSTNKSSKLRWLGLFILGGKDFTIDYKDDTYTKVCNKNITSMVTDTIIILHEYLSDQTDPRLLSMITFG